MLPIIVIASKNSNKIREFVELLKNFPVEIKSLADFGPMPEPVEDGETFEDNAYIKSLHTAKILGLPALADDSGLVVEALGGRPGVHSARYAGMNASDADNCAKLLKNMQGEKNRSAAFHCVLSLAVPSGPALTYEGRCFGKILETPRGNNGFGYDPLFYYEEMSKTFAELTMEQKSKISHRGKALREFVAEGEKIKQWIKQRLSEEKPQRPNHEIFMNNDWSK